ncbi:uncharacterized protein SPSK_02825 [Sporothrix schenckii 1099-18]|uniref:Uncharacterized protein n=1 Tax=Sporothrix schenckii 1099-18 TaxID=1397361 RepID=A0A0F2MCP5_SPOSC|nr:uncharacterized protein SPSK_02825 [Sporothrix schenckii 1099-18]KJR86605.1 hypothetical protein SPSK_02825 [Sporothrix schenckii 1099-18]
MKLMLHIRMDDAGVVDGWSRSRGRMGVKVTEAKMATMWTMRQAFRSGLEVNTKERLAPSRALWQAPNIEPSGKVGHLPYCFLAVEARAACFAKTQDYAVGPASGSSEGALGKERAKARPPRRIYSLN